MKELITELVNALINPRAVIQKKLDLKNEYQIKFDRSLHLKDYLKSKAWLEFHRPNVYKTVESGIGRLLRDSPTMTELEIRTLLADMRGCLSNLVEMRYAIEVGEEAGRKLEGLK